MRDFEGGIVRLDGAHLARDAIEAGRDGMLEAARGEQLHADADAEERPAAFVDALVDRLDHPVDGIEMPPAVGEGAVARQHDPVGARHHIGVGRDCDRLARPALADRILERLLGRVEVAGAVVDDRDAHGAAPGAGKRPTTSPASAEGTRGRRGRGGTGGMGGTGGSGETGTSASFSLK